MNIDIEGHVEADFTKSGINSVLFVKDRNDAIEKIEFFEDLMKEDGKYTNYGQWSGTNAAGVLQHDDGYFSTQAWSWNSLAHYYTPVLVYNDLYEFSDEISEDIDRQLEYAYDDGPTEEEKEYTEDFVLDEYKRDLNTLANRKIEEIIKSIKSEFKIE